jgi:pimeloyl-ACP methyl ester carboxylesterase
MRFSRSLRSTDKRAADITRRAAMEEAMPASFALLAVTLLLLAPAASAEPPVGAAPTVKTMSVNGTAITYVEQGTGTAVVFVHGAMSDHRIWEPQREPVAKSYRFIAIDQRYFGAAPWSDKGERFSPATHVADLAGFIRALNAGPVFLVGRSYGASIALTTAVQYPDLVRGLLVNEPQLTGVLVDPSDQKVAAADRKGLDAVRAAAAAGRSAEATKLFYDWVNDQPGGFETLPAKSKAMFLDNARTVRSQVTAPTTPTTCAEAGRLTVPVTITKGALTRPFFKVIAEATGRCIPRSKLITIEGARHGAPAQAPAAFNEVLLAFLADAPSPAVQDETTPVPGREIAAALNLHQKDIKADGTLFLPREVRQFRAVVVVMNHGDSEPVYQDPEWRKAAEALASGLLHVRISRIGSSARTRVSPSGRIVPDVPPVAAPLRNAAVDGAAGALLTLLDRFAQESGHQELKSAPLLFWGHSAAGNFGPTFAALHPGRTIAFVSYHSHRRGLPHDMKVVTRIPALLFAGRNDDTVDEEEVEDLWRSGRSRNAPWTFVLRSDAPHRSVEALKKANDLAIPWITAVVRQRVTPGGTGLRPVSDSTAWIGDHKTLEIASHGSSPGSRTDASWLPDETSARAWRAISEAASNQVRARRVGPNGEVDGLTAKFVDVNGVRTRYYDYGRGEAIVLVHGGYPGSPFSANGWSRNIAGLAKKFRVLAMDGLAQGMTGSPREDKDFGFRGQIEHLYQFIRALKLDTVHLVGSSSGGDRALALALDHPELVKTLTWIGGGSALRKSPSRLTVAAAKCGSDRLSPEYEKCRMLARAPSPGTFPPEFEKASEWMWNLPVSVETRKRLAAMRSAGTQVNVEEQVYTERRWTQVRGGALQMPILIYKGRQDPFDWDADAPYAGMQGALAFVDMVGAKNPRVKFIVIDGAGHFPYREQPEQFNADLIQFIEFWNSHHKTSQGVARAGEERRPLAMTNVTVIDVETGGRRADETVVISGGRITAVGPARTARIPAGARVVSGHGKYLIPGLWDMHSHAFRRWDVAAPQYLANGVLGLREMGVAVPFEKVAAQRAAVRAGQIVGPQYLTPGPLLAGRDAFPQFPDATVVVTSPDEARRAVDSLARAGVDFIKVHNYLSRDAFFAIAREARSRGLPFAGHLPRVVSVAEGSNAGMRSMEHLRGVEGACSADEGAYLRVQREAVIDAGAPDRDTSPVGLEAFLRALNTYTPAKCAALGTLLARNGTWITPTLVGGISFHAARDSLLRDPRLRYVPPAVVDDWRRRLTEASTDPSWAQWQRLRPEIVREFQRAGVGLLTGTDAGAVNYSQINVFYGFAVHDELRLLVDAGLTPLDALRTATLNPARYLDATDSHGTIAVGNVADLVLLDADPLVDIRNTARIHAVVANGTLIDGAERQRLLDGVASAVQKQ